MEMVLIFFLKASSLIGVYFLAYHFFLRKETFFTTNRWYLLAGLFTSVLMPLFFIKKVIWIEKKEPIFHEIVQFPNSSPKSFVSTPPETFTIDWNQILIACYVVVVAFLIIKIVINLISLFKLLNDKQIERHDQFSLVDLNEDIAPFSFFHYIVYNSNYYSKEELRSILLHEKIHSQEKHSIDVMIAKLFCIVFWFNPFVWLYKKAMIQNLEYIADQKACLQIEDRKVYQKALLKVVTHQNCLSITNQFYQSLIKKRIVMLNKNQSHKMNSWKYTIVLPVLVAFFIAFQIKIIAQEKQNSNTEKAKINVPNQNVTEMVWTKNSSDEELKRDIESMKKEGVTVSYSKLKRNSKGEITSIKVEFKDKSGKSGVNYVMSDEPIKPIYLRKTNDYVGFGKSSSTPLSSHNKKDGNHEEEYSFSFSDEDDLSPMTPLADLEIPEPPVPPVPPYNNLMEAPNAPSFPRIPNAPRFPSDMQDEKSMAAFEKEMLVFEKKMKQAEKEFEAKMEIFEKQMNENDPKMKNFEKEMEKFEEEMEKYQERYQEKFQNHREIEIEKREAARDVQREAMQEAAYARREANQARREAMKAREEALKDAEAARKDAEAARKDAIKERKK